MLYQLPTPIAGQTHALINYIEIRPDTSIEIAGVLGMLDKEEFAPLYDFGGLSFRRVIVGEELAAFTAETVRRGVSVAALAAALLTWLDSMGLEKSRYVGVVGASAAVEGLVEG